MIVRMLGAMGGPKLEPRRRAGYDERRIATGGEAGHADARGIDRAGEPLVGKHGAQGRDDLPGPGNQLLGAGASRLVEAIAEMTRRRDDDAVAGQVLREIVMPEIAAAAAV